MLSQTLIQNATLFAWTISDMMGVCLDIITHRLSIYKATRPIAQNKNKNG